MSRRNSTSPPVPDAAAATAWLIGSQQPDGGWGGDAASPSSLEETAVAVEALAAMVAMQHGAQLAGHEPAAGDPEPALAAIGRGAAWLIEQTGGGRRFPPAPIGFYFARLWYYEQLYPLIFTAAALDSTVNLARQLADTPARFAENAR